MLQSLFINIFLKLYLNKDYLIFGQKVTLRSCPWKSASVSLRKAPGYKGCPMSDLFQLYVWNLCFTLFSKGHLFDFLLGCSSFYRATSYRQNIGLKRKLHSTIQGIRSLPPSEHKFPQLEINKAELQDLRLLATLLSGNSYHWNLIVIWLDKKC